MNAVMDTPKQVVDLDSYAVIENRSRKTVLNHGNLLYRLAIGVDIEKFTKLDILGQSLTQAATSKVLNLAAERALLDRENWHCQPRGDGELAILPADIDVAWVLSEFTTQVIEALAEISERSPALPRIRLRMAMHHGPLINGHLGPVGNAPIATCHLLDAAATRRALAKESSSSVVLIVSEQLFTDVVSTRFYGLTPERFERIRLSAKGVSYTAYLCTKTPTGRKS